MDIVVVGTGYVGIVTGTCLAESGNRVICVDIDEEKIAMMEQGKVLEREAAFTRIEMMKSSREIARKRRRERRKEKRRAAARCKNESSWNAASRKVASRKVARSIFAGIEY